MSNEPAHKLNAMGRYRERLELHMQRFCGWRNRPHIDLSQSSTVEQAERWLGYLDELERDCKCLEGLREENMRSASKPPAAKRRKPKRPARGSG